MFLNNFSKQELLSGGGSSSLENYEIEGFVPQSLTPGLLRLSAKFYEFGREVFRALYAYEMYHLVLLL